MSTANEICVSVIIPVYNEAKFIARCMESLITQSFPRDKMEWIVIDGFSTDCTREILERYTAQYPILLLSNEKKTAPSSLNMGIKAASGRYIIRLDAHSTFPHDYIENCVNCLKTIEADNVGGYIETRAEGFIGEAIAKLLSSRFGVGDSSFRVSGESGYVDTVPFGAFKREVFDRIGLFNENLLRSEDNEFNARILKSGGKIYLSKNIHSVYYCRDSVAALLKQGLQNGNALFHTIRQNPGTMRVRHFVPFFFLLSLIVLPIASFFCLPARWLFIVELSVYLLADIFFSFFCGSPQKGIVTFWLYPLYHLTYGLGSLLGLLGMRLY